MDVGEVNPISSWNVDPNEPRYCLCNDVSYGEMVGCDNEDVSAYFFHVIYFCLMNYSIVNVNNFLYSLF